jgi:hypothetical protein
MPICLVCISCSIAAQQLHYALLRPDHNHAASDLTRIKHAFIYAHRHANTHTHIVYSASSLPDAVANKYLLHYTHLTNRRPCCALMEYNK